MKPSVAASALLLGFLGTLFCLRMFDMPEARTTLLLLGLTGSIATALAAAQGPHPSFPLPFLLAGVSAACVAGALAIDVPDERSIGRFANGDSIRLTGYVAKHPDRRPMKTHYVVQVESITTDEGKTLPVEGRVLAIDRNGWPEFAQGERVRVHGALERPWNDGTFAYDAYLSIGGITALLDYASLESLEPGTAFPVTRLLNTVRDGMEARINRIFPEPHASLLAGLLTGSRRGIPPALTEAFNVTGLTHIIAISGYNITIITAIVSSLLFFLPIRWRVAPVILMIGAFTLFVGAGPPVVRAAIMGSLGLLAVVLERQAHTRLLILWSAAAMSVWNPRLLWYDAGFQLSFAAVIGLNELSPLLHRAFARVPTAFGIRTGLEATMAAQIATLPLIIVLFRRISLIAPVANILVAPLVPLAMLFGFLGVSASYVLFPLGQVIGFVAWGFLQVIILCAIVLAKVPFAAVEV